MITIYDQKNIDIRWEVFKVANNVHEDFSQSEIWMFLVSDEHKYPLHTTLDGNFVLARVDAGAFAPGTYSAVLMWLKNQETSKDLTRTELENIFALTPYEEEDTSRVEGDVTVTLKSMVATYGYDGLDAYERAILLGRFWGSEEEWMQSLGDHDLANYYTKGEVDELIDNVEVDLTDYYTKEQTDSKINEAAGGLRDRVEENTDAINDISQRVSTNTQGIADNAGNIAANTDAITENTNDINQLKAGMTNIGGRVDGLETEFGNFVGLNQSNYQGIFEDASALASAHPTMTGAGWALVGTDMTALSVYVWNMNASAWSQYGTRTYDYTDFSTVLSQVATIGSNLGDLGTKVGVYSSVLFEIGNITIDASGWTYGGSTKRVRLKEGFTLHLYEGDVISLTDYSDARYYLGWRVDGTYYYKGWNTTDFLVSTEADYVILLSNRTETAQTSIDALYSLLSIKTYNDNGTLLERVNEVIVSDPIDGIDVASKINSRYVNWSTGAYTNTGSYFDVYQIENSDYISISINCGYSDAGATAIAFYNDTPSASSYMQSYSVRGAANTRIYSAQIPDGCKYIAVTNRNSIVSSPTIALTQNKVDVAYKAKNDFKEYKDSVTNDYAEELLTTLTITSSSASTTVSSDYFSFKAGDVLKIVCEKDTPTNYGTFRFGETGFLTSNNDLVDGGIQYVAIPYAMSTKLYLIARELDYISISIYKVSRTDLADIAPQYFFDLQNSRCGQKGKPEITWRSSGWWYVNYHDGYGYLAINNNLTRISTNIIYAVNPKITIKLTDNTTYRYILYTIKNLSNMTYHDSGWVTDATKTFQLYGQAFAVTLAKQDSTAIEYSDIAASGIAITFDHSCQEPFAPYRLFDGIDEQIEEISGQIGEINEQIADIDTTGLKTKTNDTINKDFTFGNHPCYGHLFIDMRGQYANPAIPCQSLFDVDATARLGFKYIETNVQTTSDGVLIPIHGVSGKFGYEVTDLNGNFTYADTLINSVTYEWIQQNIRYKTKYAKHRTSIPTLEEVFKECKSHGISVMMTYNATTYAVAKKYFNDNFIAYSGNRNLGFTGLIMHYSPLATKAEILERCDVLGAPYIHMLDNNAFDTFYNAGTLADLAKAVHEKGCLLGIAGCYQTALQNIAFFEAGGDVNASGYFVNDFPQGNICNLKGDVDYSDFTITNGSVADGVLTLASGGTISSGALSSIYLGKGSLRIRFNGTLQVTSFGHSRFTNITLSSDGTLTKWLSTYFLEQTPTFSITATESTEIYMIDYKASKV